MPVTIFSHERLTQEERIRALRKEQLRELMTDIIALVINTGKKDKALALAELINALTGQILVPREIICYSDPNHEQFAVRAADVAKSKVDNLVKDLEAHPEHYCSIDGAESSLNLLLSQLVSKLILLAGSDVNAFTQQEDGTWHQSHKLVRRFPEGLPEEHFWLLREQLHQQYCFPESRIVAVRWDIATHLRNGQEHTFSDSIEVISKPGDPELLDHFLFQALDDGQILRSNLHFAALEYLIANDRIINVSHLPHELEERGFNLADFASLEFSPAVLLAFLYSVINNTPVYIP